LGIEKIAFLVTDADTLDRKIEFLSFREPVREFMGEHGRLVDSHRPSTELAQNL